MEVIPGTLGESIDKLIALGDAVQIVKLRNPDYLAPIVARCGGRYRWVTRPASEGRNPDEIVRDATDWERAMRVAGQIVNWDRHLLWNEPNHPDSPYRGPDNAGRFVREVARPALDRLAWLRDVVRLGYSGTTPYYGTAEWAAAMAALGLLPGGHCYQNTGNVDLAVGDCLAQGGDFPAAQLLADEVGDTSLDPADMRAPRIAAQFRGLARAGTHGAILFPLAGSADTSIAYDVSTIRTVLAAGTATHNNAPEEPAMPQFENEFAAAAQAWFGGHLQPTLPAALDGNGDWVQDGHDDRHDPGSGWWLLREYVSDPGKVYRYQLVGGAYDPQAPAAAR